MLDRHIRITRLVLFTATCAAGAPVVAASFDCPSAAARIEKLICADAELSRLDDMLAADYQQALASADLSPQAALSGQVYPEDEQARRAIQRQQRAWLSRRNGCQDRACIYQAYVGRIAQLRKAECARKPTDACLTRDDTYIPKTPDGRLVLLSREECRLGQAIPGLKDQSDEMALQADCIEAGIYDPCEDAGGSSGDAQCAGANLEVAQRRIRNAERSLIESAAKWQEAGKRLQDELRTSERRWQTAQERFCSEQDRLYDSAPATQDEYDSRRAAGESNFGEKFGYCIRRVAEERAYDLEQFARTLRVTKNRAELDRLIAYLRAMPDFAARSS